MFKKLALLLVVIGSLATAKADTITQIRSSASETLNNSGSATQNLAPNAAWAPAFSGSNWISFARTGNPSTSGFVDLPNGTAVTFSDIFTLSGPVTAATLMVMADDTSSVMVNGTTIFAANLAGPYPTCAISPIGCLTINQGTFGLAQLQPYLHIGANTISFTVYQEGRSSYGLDYSGSFGTAPVPEPSALLLLGCGLIGLALVGRRTLLG